MKSEKIVTPSSAVLDASGAIFILSSNIILETLGDYNYILSPEIFKYEIGNVCLKFSRYSDLSKEESKAYFERSMEITALANHFDFKRTIKCAEELDLSFYDASYLELALSTNSDLITRDKKLNHAAQKIGIETCF